MNMMVQPTEEVDFRKAERRLRIWLEGHSLVIQSCEEWSRWDFNRRPFWSVWGKIYGRGSGFSAEYCGIQIYDDGEVLVFSQQILQGTEEV